MYAEPPKCDPTPADLKLACASPLQLARPPAAAEAQSSLASRHINTSVSRVGSTRWDFEQRRLTDVVRASVHYFNTEAELDRCVEAVRQLAAAAAAGGGGRQ